MSLGNHLFEARKKRGLSQEEVAGKLGVSCRIFASRSGLRLCMGCLWTSWWSLIWM